MKVGKSRTRTINKGSTRKEVQEGWKAKKPAPPKRQKHSDERKYEEANTEGCKTPGYRYVEEEAGAFNICSSILEVTRKIEILNF